MIDLNNTYWKSTGGSCYSCKYNKARLLINQETLVKYCIKEKHLTSVAQLSFENGVTRLDWVNETGSKDECENYA